MKKYETPQYLKIARKPAPGEIKALEIQIDMLKERKSFMPKQIDLLRKELDSIPLQIQSLEKQLAALRSAANR